MPIPSIDLSHYNYDLPKSKIADFPASQRDQSKLLVYNKGLIEACTFCEIVSKLPSNPFLVFNNTKVFPARLYFPTDTGSFIEIFCLRMIKSNHSIGNHNTEQWECFIGNLRKWKGQTLRLQTLKANLIETLTESWVVEFAWEEDIAFFELLELYGQIPLPPYINRENQEIDKERYQTVFSKEKGSVAAPTAALHFTHQVLSDLSNANITMDEMTLHVGAGTFKPIKATTISEHIMHSESFLIKKNNLTNLLKSIDKYIIPVGTTSTRLLESLYWIGVNIINHSSQPFHVNQWEGYNTSDVSLENALNAIIGYMVYKDIEEQWASTQILILPGYKFRVAKGLITNFHQPHSTLILLIAALVGKEWKRIYEYALSHDFKFLSYGDSSLLLPE